MFRWERMRRSRARSSGSEILSRIRSLAGCTIDTPESSFQKRQPTKPTIGEIHLYIPAYSSLRANCEYIANDEHPDHQLRINRGPTHFGVKGRQLRTNP